MAMVESFDASASDQVRQPVERASHAPGSIYWSPEIYEREKERIFMRDWLCLARAEEIPNPGDYMTFRIMGEPVLAVRNQDGAVNAFANLCLHRGVEIATGTGNVPRFECPYHNWLYDLDGNLIGAPFMLQSEGFDKSTCRLRRLRLAQWAGFIFVNFDPRAEDFEKFVSEFAADVDFLRMEDCRLGSKLIVDLDCNWKLVVENLMDVYHAQTVHAKSFGKHRGSPDKYPFELRKYGGTWTVYEAAPMTPDGKSRFGPMPAVAERGDRFACSGHLGPNMQVIARCDHIHPLVMWPVSPTKSRTIVYNLYPKEFTDLPDFADRANVYHDYMDLVLGEDRDMVRSLQFGIQSDHFSPGRMSFLEKGIHHVLNDYTDRMFGSD